MNKLLALNFDSAGVFFSVSLVATHKRGLSDSQGFPGSVTPDYVPFQMWDTLQVNAKSFVFTVTVCKLVGPKNYLGL